MIFINHRVNTLEQLKKIPKENGIEIDVRYHNNDLVLDHDPFNHHIKNPLKLETLLQNYNLKGVLILNIKTEGIEEECIKLMTKYKIDSWFFLDLSMPYFVIYSNKNTTGFSDSNLAVRFSEFEPIDYTLAFVGKVKWVWIDCFTKLPLNTNNYKILKENGFKLCLVSPELQKHSLNKIAEYKKHLEDMNISIDAVCTKRPDLWGQETSKETKLQLEKDYPII